MAKKKQTRRASPAEISYAEMLYCEKRYTPEAIAETLGRNIKTIYTWRDDNGWEETKDLLAVGPTELKKILLKEAVRIAKGEARKDDQGNEVKGIDADALSKVMKAYDYMSQRTSPEVIHDVLVELDNYMVTIDPVKASEFTKYHAMFLQDRINQES